MSDAATHSALVQLAERWLLGPGGCGVAFTELAPCAASSEIPDAIGFTPFTSVLIECKASRADFLADRRKQFRKHPELGMGRIRFYLAPTGVVRVDDLPPRWGLLNPAGGGVRRVYGPDPKRLSAMVRDAWFHAHNAAAEHALMYSALRRLHLRGHLPTIYEAPK